MHQRFAKKTAALVLFLVAGYATAAQGTLGMPARFAVTPDNNLELLLSVINSARTSLLVNIYQFEHPKILEAINGLLRRGVSVEILLEGEPLGNIPPDGKKTIQTLVQGMRAQAAGRSRFFLMTKEASSKGRRYRFNHAKYVVADQAETLVTSDNFKRSGHPEAGWVGNRGWDVAIRDADLAARMTRIFREDVDLSKGDVLELAYGSKHPPARSRDTQQPGDSEPQGKRRTVTPFALGTGEVAGATIVASPNSLPGLTAFMRSAKLALDLQHMSLPATWRDGDRAVQSPLVREALDAGRRGAQVRVLLNDDAAFGVEADGPLKGNELTAALINDAAECENLRVTARIIDLSTVQITYIHNKGALADGHRALVSSINGTQNSVLNNREIAVDLDSADAARYYGSVFDFDWKSSSRQPRTPGGPGCRSWLVLSETPGVLAEGF